MCNRNIMSKYKMTEEHKRKIGEANKGKPSYWKGKKRSKQNIENIKKAAQKKRDNFPKIKCKWCKKEFQVIPARKNMAKFCSVDCSNKYKKENPVSYWKGKKRGKEFSELMSRKTKQNYKDGKMEYMKKVWQEVKDSGRWKGANNPRWTGGSFTDKHGYRKIKMPEHPRADSSGYVKEHMAVAEKCLGRMLDKNTEVVHHINEDKTDNRPENLRVMKDKEHRAYHGTKNKKILKSNLI